MAATLPTPITTPVSSVSTPCELTRYNIYFVRKNKFGFSDNVYWGQVLSTKTKKQVDRYYRMELVNMRAEDVIVTIVNEMKKNAIDEDAFVLE